MSADRPPTPASESPEETRLHDALERVATQRPVADGWDAIVERLTDEADGTTVVTPLSAGSALRGRPSGRRLALIAACVAAVGALAVGVVALAGRDDDKGQVTLTPPPADTTGWYVPRDLPAGWVLEIGGYRPRRRQRGTHRDLLPLHPRRLSQLGKRAVAPDLGNPQWPGVPDR